jgi:hypothetical protein
MIKNTTVLNNSNAGIYFTPSESATVDGTLDQVTANLNTYGMYFDASPSNSFANAGVAGITVRIDDAHAVLNVKNGVVINPGSGGIVSIFKNTRIYQNNTGGSLNADLVANSSSQGAPQGVNLTDRNEIGLIGNNNAANSVVYTDGTNYITGTRLGQNVTLQTAPPQ